MAERITTTPIGIDPGTTNSCVGVWREGWVEIIPNQLGNRTTPSCVAFTNTRRYIGEDAKCRANTDPCNTILRIPIDKVAALNQNTRDFVGRKLLELTLKELFVFRFMQVLAGCKKNYMSHVQGRLCRNFEKIFPGQFFIGELIGEAAEASYAT